MTTGWTPRQQYKVQVSRSQILLTQYVDMKKKPDLSYNRIVVVGMQSLDREEKVEKLLSLLKHLGAKPINHIMEL